MASESKEQPVTWYAQWSRHWQRTGSANTLLLLVVVSLICCIAINTSASSGLFLFANCHAMIRHFHSFVWSHTAKPIIRFNQLVTSLRSNQYGRFVQFRLARSCFRYHWINTHIGQCRVRWKCQRNANVKQRIGEKWRNSLTGLTTGLAQHFEFIVCFSETQQFLCQIHGTCRSTEYFSSVFFKHKSSWTNSVATIPNAEPMKERKIIFKKYLKCSRRCGFVTSFAEWTIHLKYIQR